MPKIAYINKKFASETLSLIETCNRVIVDYQAQGFNLTLRQLYYQMVSRNIIPNTEKSYKRLGSIVNDARLAGLIDWSAIEDRGRNLRQNPHWADPASIIAAARQSFRLDKWEDQKYRPEVWIEKQALEGVIAGVCAELDVPYFACKGYNSQSEQWRAGQRMKHHIDNGQIPIMFHLGDHDPSGIDMTRDNGDRLSMFMGGVEVKRLALNMNQIEEYNPPPNPAKEVDSRFAQYVELYGYESWELDALEPQVIADLIRQAIYSIRDHTKWMAVIDEESEQKQLLSQAEDRWDDIVEFLQNQQDD